MFYSILLFIVLVKHLDVVKLKNRDSLLLKSIEDMKEMIKKQDKDRDEFITSHLIMIRDIVAEHKTTSASLKHVTVRSFKGSARYDATKILYDYGMAKNVSVHKDDIWAEISK